MYTTFNKIDMTEISDSWISNQSKNMLTRQKGGCIIVYTIILAIGGIVWVELKKK